MTLLGFRKLKCIRGNLSVIFKGRGMENEGISNQNLIL
jgi:hypothetical protein